MASLWGVYMYEFIVTRDFIIHVDDPLDSQKYYLFLPSCQFQSYSTRHHPNPHSWSYPKPHHYRCQHLAKSINFPHVHLNLRSLFNFFQSQHHAQPSPSFHNLRISPHKLYLSFGFHIRSLHLSAYN